MHKKGTHYEVEVVNGAKVFDVRVDAASGNVLSTVGTRQTAPKRKAKKTQPCGYCWLNAFQCSAMHDALE